MANINVSKHRAKYLAEYPRCQYTQAVGRYVPFSSSGTVCIEHIWNRRCKASESWSNYATVCPAAHRWKHDCSVIARIAIMWFKMTLGGEHFNMETLREASGFYVPGWVEVQLETRPDLPKWCWDMGREIMEAF